jgi:hypothetical protein
MWLMTMPPVALAHPQIRPPIIGRIPVAVLNLTRRIFTGHPKVGELVGRIIGTIKPNAPETVSGDVARNRPGRNPVAPPLAPVKDTALGVIGQQIPQSLGSEWHHSAASRTTPVLLRHLC